MSTSLSAHNYIEMKYIYTDSLKVAVEARDISADRPRRVLFPGLGLPALAPQSSGLK